jgi:uncharacterized membrane protein YccF (DUF307 family)
MSLIGNVLWIVFGGGIVLFLEYLLGGLVLCLTVIGIPFGVQALKLALLALLPFGKEITRAKSASGCLSTILNIIWIIIAGIPLALTHLVFGVLWAITIIGLPFAKQHLKLASLALTPFGHAVR